MRSKIDEVRWGKWGGCRQSVVEKWEKIKFFTEKQDRGMIKLVVDLYFGGAKCIIHMLWGLII